MLPKQNVRPSLPSIFATALMAPLLLLLATGCSLGDNDDDRREWRQEKRERAQERREEQRERKQEKRERQQRD